MGVEEKYADYNFVVLTDRELQIGGKPLEYDSAYNDEFDSSAGVNRYYLAVSRVNLTPKYSNRRFLIKRTPVKIEHCATMKLIAVLTEQYIGKSQIRFYNEETSIEYAKIIPEYAIITDMKFLEIDGQEYFAFSRFDVDDVYEQIQEIDQVAKHEQTHSALLNTKLVLYKVYSNKIEFFSELKFQENYPISTFVVTGESIVCCVGPYIYRIQKRIPLQVTQQPVALETMIEHLIDFGNRFICIRAGQITLLDDQFNQILINNDFLDIKLACVMDEEHFLVATFNNTIAIFNKQLQLLSKYTATQNITCLKQQNKKVFMGTDTGSIVVFCNEQIKELNYLQQGIIQHYEQLNQKLFVNSDSVNTIDGNIIKLYLQMSKGDQQQIAQNINMDQEQVLEMLIGIGIDIAE